MAWLSFALILQVVFRLPGSGYCWICRYIKTDHPILLPIYHVVYVTLPCMPFQSSNGPAAGSPDPGSISIKGAHISIFTCGVVGIERCMPSFSLFSLLSLSLSCYHCALTGCRHACGRYTAFLYRTRWVQRVTFDLAYTVASFCARTCPPATAAADCDAPCCPLARYVNVKPDCWTAAETSTTRRALVRRVGRNTLFLRSRYRSRRHQTVRLVKTPPACLGVAANLFGTAHLMRQVPGTFAADHR